MLYRSFLHIRLALASCLIANCFFSTPVLAQEMNWPKRISSNIASAVEEENKQVVITIDGELQCNYGGVTAPIQATGRTATLWAVIPWGWGEEFKCECSVDFIGCSYAPTVVAPCPEKFEQIGSECPRAKREIVESIEIVDAMQLGPYELREGASVTPEELCANVCHTFAAQEAASYAPVFCANPPTTEVYRTFSCKGMRGDLPPLGVPNLIDITPAYRFPIGDEELVLAEQAHYDSSTSEEPSSSISEQQSTATEAADSDIVSESIDSSANAFAYASCTASRR